jgi:hypothetical protein
MAYNIHLGFHPQPNRVLFAWLERQTGMRVASGPFRGMKLVNAEIGSSLMPKMVGTYELELQKDLEVLLQNKYHYFLDVGAAEGYYAVGVALRFAGRRTMTYAYDVAPESALAVREAALANGLGAGIELRTLCRHEDFEMARNDRTLVICDIEGAEAGLLDPYAAPGLQNCDIVVELHDRPVKHSMGELLAARFSKTHSVNLHEARPRLHSDLGRFRWKLTSEFGQKIMDEGRAPGMEWLVLKARKFPKA